MATKEDIINRALGDPPPQLDDTHFNTMQEIVTAIYDIPGVADKVDTYMRGRGIEDPQAEICALRKVIF